MEYTGCGSFAIKVVRQTANILDIYAESNPPNDEKTFPSTSIRNLHAISNEFRVLKSFTREGLPIYLFRPTVARKNAGHIAIQA